jgi:hypothetical protein
MTLSSKLISIVTFTLAANQALAATALRGIAWPYFESTDVSEVYNDGVVSWVYDYEK